MIVMPANSSGLFTGYLMGKYPGQVGWIIGPGGWREPRDFIQYCFDNGAFPVWSKGKKWDEAPFYELCRRIIGREHKPRWIAVPDVVSDREATICSWNHHSPKVAAFGVPLAFVVQDGMTPDDVPDDAEVVFVGGSTDWKWRNLTMWTKSFPRVHVGRVNGERGLWLCHEAGAESCDGTGWFRGDQKQLAGLVRYLELSNY